ncbi:MAG: hypothetical protein JNK82_26925 [Myxococcaceae bacterium]|nr:hypothetical protein [Myxococcaceae bacterium]
MKPWLIAFALTQLVEVPIYLVAASSTESGRKWVAAFGASAITHPVVWFVFPRYWPTGHWWQMVACAELFAVAVEAAWLASFGVKRPIEWSFFANATSFGLGLVLQHFRVI